MTHHPTAELLCDWTPDGRLVFQAFGMGTYPRAASSTSVDARRRSAGEAAGALRRPRRRSAPTGSGSPTPRTPPTTAPGSATGAAWPPTSGSSTSTTHLSQRSPTGRAPTRCRCGTAARLYYLSDAGPEHRLNLWCYDPAGGARQVTRFADYDVKWPAIGPGPAGQGEIVFQHGRRPAAARPRDRASARGRGHGPGRPRRSCGRSGRRRASCLRPPSLSPPASGC